MTTTRPVPSRPAAGRPIRVLHLATVPFRPEEGVSRAVTELAAALGDHGVQSHLAADRPVGDAFCGLHRQSHWRPARVALGRALREAVIRVRPDLVHLHGGVLAPALALSPALRGLPKVATMYHLLPPPRRELGWRSLADARRSSVRPARLLASGLAGLPMTRTMLGSGVLRAVCTPDPRVMQALAAHGPVVMAQGGAVPGPVRPQWSATPTIGFAGRAEPGRGVEELVAAVARLRGRVPGVRLRLFLLPGPAAAHWQAAFGSTGWIDISVGVRDDLSADLATCQVVALPFRIPATITPPLVAAEAMAAGVPVVANRLSCITPLVRDGWNGALAVDGSVDALADAIASLLVDRGTWEQRSAAAAATIESSWSWAEAALAVRGAYDIALGTVPSTVDPAVDPAVHPAVHPTVHPTVHPAVDPVVAHPFDESPFDGMLIDARDHAWPRVSAAPAGSRAGSAGDGAR